LGGLNFVLPSPTPQVVPIAANNAAYVLLDFAAPSMPTTSSGGTLVSPPEPFHSMPPSPMSGVPLVSPP